MSVRPWRTEIRFHKTGKMRPGNSGAGECGFSPPNCHLLPLEWILKILIQGSLSTRNNLLIIHLLLDDLLNFWPTRFECRN